PRGPVWALALGAGTAALAAAASALRLRPHTKDDFEDATGQLSIGVWDTTGYRRKLIDFPRHELMHLLEGSVTFTDDAGRSQTFQAGDTFFVPLGTPNAWTSEGFLRKIFVIFQPKA
ncbi:MAG: cupin domain-containing protein, partial [Aestuariivirga sp.]